MLTEYLRKETPEQAVWSGSMPGVQVCRFALRGGPPDGMRMIPVQGAPLHFETFFCLGGRLAVTPLRGAPYTVQGPGVFLISDCRGLGSCLCSGDLRGILVSADAKAAKESLMTICSILDMELDIGTVRKKMASRNGCMALLDTPWVQALFQELQRLPEAARERYCVLKSVELLYLLCSQAPAWDGAVPGPGRPVPPSISEVKAYIQAHLSEKLTIGLLCKQFSLSPTSLKEGFRRAYGTPIHAFLIRQRLKRARELLCTTPMPVQQAALAVGYESMSQFNAAFKRQYGTTPGKYRKMSETAAPRPF